MRSINSLRSSPKGYQTSSTSSNRSDGRTDPKRRRLNRFKASRSDKRIYSERELYPLWDVANAYRSGGEIGPERRKSYQFSANRSGDMTNPERRKSYQFNVIRSGDTTFDSERRLHRIRRQFNANRSDGRIDPKTKTPIFES